MNASEILKVTGEHILSGGQANRLFYHLNLHWESIPQSFTTQERPDGTLAVSVEYLSKRLKKVPLVGKMTSRGLVIPPHFISDWGVSKVYCKRISLNEFHIYRTFTTTHILGHVQQDGRLTISRLSMRMLSHHFPGVQFEISCSDTNNYLIVKRI